MIFKHFPAHWQQFRSKISAAPLELRAYCLFATEVTIFEILIVFIKPNNIIFTIIPYTGSLPALGYMYGLFFTFALLLGTHVKGKRIYVLLGGIILPLMFHIIFGLIAFQDFGHPYSHISQWQPIWTVIIPLFWIGILLSGNVRRYCKTLDAAATR